MVVRKLGRILVSIAALLTMLGVVFGLLLVPTPVRRSGHWCPSLLDVALLGPNPSARVKTELGMPLGSFYYACTRKGPVEAWALFWLAMVVVLFLVMIVVLGQLGLRTLAAILRAGHLIREGRRVDQAPSRVDVITARPEPGTGPPDPP